MKKLLISLKQAVQRRLLEPRILWRFESVDLKTTVEIRHALPVLAFVILFIWYLAAPLPVVMMSMLTLGGILLSAFLWARAQARGVHAQRRLRFAAMQVGDELEEQISLDNKTLLPVIWAEFLDRSNIPDYTVSSARAAGPSSHMEWRAHTICTRRGVFDLGPWELRMGEPFGILQIRQVYIQRQEILVYPPLALLPERVLPHRGAVGDHRPLNQPLRAETIATYSVRSYSPGDPLRHIHWRTTARRVDPFVKVFSPEAVSNIWLVPDFNALDHTGAGALSSEEAMVTVTASLAAALLQQNLAVGMFAAAENDTVVLPRQGQPHLWRILQSLAPLRAVSNQLPEKALNRASTLVSGNDLLLFITPSLRPDWVSVLRQISRSRGSRGRAEVVLLDPASFNGSLDGQAAEIFLSFLLEQGLPANLLRREDIQLVSGFYGEVSRWEFSVLGTGRVIARKAPRTAFSPLQSDRQGGILTKSRTVE